MNKYIAQLAALDWAKVLGIGAAAAVAYFFLMYNDGSQLTTDIANQKAALTTANQKLAETEKAMENAKRFEREVQENQRQFQRITEFMPTNMSSAELSALVNQQAQTSGVRVLNMKPKGETETIDFYQTTKVDVELEGSFSQVVTFLSYMSRVPRLLSLEGTQITQKKQGADNASSELSFKATLTGYRYLSDEARATALVKGVPPKPGAAGGKK